jgi:hypothetical protein
MFNKKQKGLSPIGVLFMVCFFALTLLIALKLSTHYMDFFSIRSAFQEQATLPSAKTAGYREMMDNVDKQLRMNSVRDFDFKNAYFSKSTGVPVIGFAYEVREHMFANIDVVLSFEFEQEIE